MLHLPVSKHHVPTFLCVAADCLAVFRQGQHHQRGRVAGLLQRSHTAAAGASGCNSGCDSSAAHQQGLSCGRSGPQHPLHPPLHLGTFRDWFYPGYRVQHGLTPGADISLTQPKKVQSQAGRGQPSEASSFPAAAHGWEEQLLQQAMQDLTAKAPQRPPGSAGTDALAAATAATEPPWSVNRQLFTMHQALAAAAAPGISHSGADNTTGWILAEQQPQQWHTHPQRCLVSVRSTADMSAQDAEAQGAQGGQRHHALFSVYVHTTAGMLLPRDSLFAGCELPVRLNASQGYAQHVLAEAGALLLAAALSDPLNAKFVLVSDTSIPLYPP